MKYPSPMALAAMLYRLAFPTRDFKRLPTQVQRSYRRDAERLLEMMKEGV